jgi:DNA-binding MarR family transcriptional regulator
MASESERYVGLAGVRYALRRFLASSETISRQAGVTPQQYQALLAVRAWPGEAMAVKDLADQLLLTHQAAVQMLDRLARAGLAERKPSAEDRRSVIIRLTPKGETLLSDLAAQHLEAMLGQEPLLTESLQRLRSLKR